MIKPIAQLAIAAVMLTGSPTVGGSALQSQQPVELAYGGDPCFGVGSENCCKEFQFLAGISCSFQLAPACIAALAGVYFYCS